MTKLSQTLRETLERGGKRGVTLQQVLKACTDWKPGVVKGQLNRRVGKGEVVEVPGGRYRLAEKAEVPKRAARQAAKDKQVVDGRITVHREGYGFVIPSEDTTNGQDVFLPRHETGGAMDGDLVRIECQAKPDRDGRFKGRLLEILERSRTHLCGYLERTGRRTYRLFPTNPEVSVELVLRPQDLGDAEEGQVVIARITDFGSETTEPTGVVEQVLGAADDPANDAAMIISEHAIRDTWPDAVLAEQERVPKKIPRKREGRLDLRDQPCFTIDGKDARDLDDAVYLEDLPEGYRLWVHIADVSHYVLPGSAIDDEAQARGTSTYLPDRVVPMLPVALSNGICSLNPEEDRFALSCRMDFDLAAELVDSEVVSTIIRSHVRLNYEEVHQACVDRDPDVRKRLGTWVRVLERMFDLSDTMRARRRRRGALDFDMPEVRVKVDEAGRPVGLKPKGDNKAYGLIEMFMVAANEAVSEWMLKGKKPFVYRCHGRPDPQKIGALAEVAADLGLPTKQLRGNDPIKGLQELLKASEGTPEESLLRMMTLRTMQLAEYKAENEGHFGLCSPAYTHFTSPIRRYPDLIVHRLLKHRTGFQKLSKRAYGKLVEDLPALTKQLSVLERKAEDAERDATKLKKIHWLSSNEQEGTEHVGQITGVKDFGCFVELEGVGVDGLVHVSDLGQEYWQYEAEKRRFVGSDSGTVLRLGDRLKVRIAGVDLRDRRIRLESLGLAGVASLPSAKATKPRKGAWLSAKEEQERRESARAPRPKPTRTPSSASSSSSRARAKAKRRGRKKS